MRTLILLALVASTLAPSVAAWRPGEAVVLAEVPDATLLTWSPVPGATHYAIYRGPTPDDLVRVGESQAPLFVDDAPSGDLTYYAVTAFVDGQESDTLARSDGGPACLQVFDGLRFRLNLKRCLTT